MKTEAQKRYRRGFFLSEQELRRTVDTVVTQFAKSPCSCIPLTDVELKFRNGAISETNALDDVFQVENGGSSSIDRLRVRIHEPQKDPTYSVELTLARADLDDDDHPIRYVVRGNDRDWVFVTSSLLEERLSRVRRFVLYEILWSRRLFPLITTLVLMIGMVVGISRSTGFGTHRRALADSVENEWRRGVLRDPIEVALRFERARAREEASISLRRIFLYPWIIGLASLALLFAVSKMRPGYTFYWGDAAAAYDRRLKVTYFVLVVVILGTVLSVLGSVLANRLRI
jgi:hypothetical protein